MGKIPPYPLKKGEETTKRVLKVPLFKGDARQGRGIHRYSITPITISAGIAIIISSSTWLALKPSPKAISSLSIKQKPWAKITQGFYL
jgi:hypothetical protein